MKKRNAPLVIGNWKLNPANVGQAKNIFLEIRKSVSRRKLNCTVAIAPPYPYLSSLDKLSPSDRVGLCAQDAFYENKGTYTGQVSPGILKSVGVSSVILGHSEMRALGETDEIVAKKTAAVLKAGLTAVVCVGEQKRDSHGDYFSFVEKEVKAAVSSLTKNNLSRLVIAYEPIWAISKGDGKGKTATNEDVQEMKLFILKVLADIFDRKTADKVRVIYGGSVNSKNAEKLLSEGEVDGFLVGGASLKPNEFIKIINIANEHGK